MKIPFMKRNAVVLLSSMLLYSCDRPECKNHDPVFTEFSPDANEYKAELISQINSADARKLTYWIDKFTTNDSQYYLVVYVQGEKICAKAMLDITDSERFKPSKIAVTKRRKGGFGYHGAELSGLKYRIDSTGNNYNFVFESVDHVID